MGAVHRIFRSDYSTIGQLLIAICETQMNEALFTEWNCYETDVQKVPNVLELEPFLERCQLIRETLSNKPEKTSLCTPQHSQPTSSSKHSPRPVMVNRSSRLFPIGFQGDHSVMHRDIFKSLPAQERNLFQLLVAKPQAGRLCKQIHLS